MYPIDIHRLYIYIHPMGFLPSIIKNLKKYLHDIPQVVGSRRRALIQRCDKASPAAVPAVPGLAWCVSHLPIGYNVVPPR